MSGLSGVMGELLLLTTYWIKIIIINITIIKVINNTILIQHYNTNIITINNTVSNDFKLSENI